MKKRILTVLAALLILAGCEMQMPNPVIGTYILRAEEDRGLFHCGFSFTEDGKFTYAEVVEGKTIVKATGSYSVDLHSFDFVTSSGAILLKAENIAWPEGESVGSIYLEEGNNSFYYDWTCDRNNGPKGMTLVRNPYQQDENLELVYAGGPAKLDSFLE